MKVEKGCDMKVKGLMLLTVAMVFCLPEMAIAYVGPGAGLTLIGSLIGLLIAILTALGIILYWPVRALIRRIRGKQPTTATMESDNVPETSPESALKNNPGTVK